MKKLVSLRTWVDLTDGHEYVTGEAFPHDGREIPDDRLAALSGAENDAGMPMITETEVPDVKPKGKKDK